MFSLTFIFWGAAFGMGLLFTGREALQILALGFEACLKKIVALSIRNCLGQKWLQILALAIEACRTIIFSRRGRIHPQLGLPAWLRPGYQSRTMGFDPLS